jgi:GNAT superfamily N-acetyltransferase
MRRHDERRRWRWYRRGVASTGRVGGATFEHRPLTLGDRTEWARLLAACFGRTSEQMERLLDWFHAGFTLVTMGAWDGDRLVAQYNCRLLALDIGHGATLVSAGMGLNMAVDPDYRGRGLLETVAAPVHEEIARRGCVAGVGFSSVGGLAVAKASTSYGYTVLGPMTSTVALLTSRGGAREFEVLDTFPDGELPLDGGGDLIRYRVTAASLRHRFAEHPFRRYAFGVWRSDDRIRGLTVQRDSRLRGVRAVSLLAAYGDDLEGLLSRWSSAMRARRRPIAHLVSSPEARIRTALRAAGPCVPVPFGRDRYHLIARALAPDAPADLLRLDRWDCAGGDIL